MLSSSPSVVSRVVCLLASIGGASAAFSAPLVLRPSGRAQRPSSCWPHSRSFSLPTLSPPAVHHGLVMAATPASTWVCQAADGRWEWGAKLPPAIFCIGLNYRAHATELGKPLPTEPVVFSKSPACLVPPGGDIVLPPLEKCVDYEGELVVVIGDRPVKDIKASQALSYVKGYAVANDVSGRSWQFDRPNGGQWVRSKCFDTFFPLSPMVPAESIVDPQGLVIQTTINGQVVQKCSTSDMLFSVAEIIEFLSISSTLLPGTLISTGTPVGVGHTSNPQRYLRDGDVVRVRIEGVGEVENKVRQG